MVFRIAVVAAVAAVLLANGPDGRAAADERFDDKIVPVMIVSADYQQRADQADYRTRFDEYLVDLDEWFSWSTGGLTLDRVEPQFLTVPHTNAELWCTDLPAGGTPIENCDGGRNNLETNIDHLLQSNLGLRLRPLSIGAASPAPWVALWGGGGYAGEPMVGDTAFYMYMNNGSCDGILRAFPGDNTTSHCALTTRSAWVGAGLGSAIHELAHQAWDLSHPIDLPTEFARPPAARPTIADPSGHLMSTPSQFPAVAWADFEIDMIERLDARYHDLANADSPISHVETSTYVVGNAKPAFPSVPTVLATRDGSTVRLEVSIAGSSPTPTYRVFAMDTDRADVPQHVPVLTATASGDISFPFEQGACFIVMAWSPDHRPSMPSNRFGACVDADPATAEATDHAPSIEAVPSLEVEVDREIEPLQIAASDLDRDHVVFSVTGLPTGLSFDPARRLVTGTPTLAEVALVDIAANDGRGGFDQHRFTWTVVPSQPDPDLSDYAPDEACGPAVQQAGEARLSGVVLPGSTPFDGRDGYAAIAEDVGSVYRFNDQAAESSIRICVGVEAAGEFLVFASTVAPDSRSDSFFVQIDGGEVFPWHLPQSTVWRRNVLRPPASSPMILELDAGDHIVEFFHREDGVRMETFELVRVS